MGAEYAVASLSFRHFDDGVVGGVNVYFFFHSNNVRLNLTKMIRKIIALIVSMYQIIIVYSMAMSFPKR